ncbi:porin family protein [Flavobacterium sp. ov086]|uniref:type IX secretion/gliding motility protein PorT/SprT n=1 Tax=Flavobacterium sp. ov086 TaxID=1761785 RepID=UPI000B74BF5D|nr:porin family protein [Flavobacterium sp. ov086]SNR94626.1 Outer membrane protein beta-barrel domain-containing protein [Flavobacterium sp. ov086]
MKKTVILILLVLLSSKGYSQFAKSMFSKDPIINLENWQKQRLYFGYYLGFNSFDFKIDYKTPVPDDIQVKKTTGFNVGVVADLRLQEYINLRFEPGLYYTKRDLYYPHTPGALESFYLREVNSTYIHFPLLLKFSALRTGNIRPYLVGGMSSTLNLSSNAKSKDDNFEGKFRVKQWTAAYELGFGIDFFSEYFIFSPSIRGMFGITDELIRDNPANGASPWTGNIDSMKSRAILINFTFH